MSRLFVLVVQLLIIPKGLFVVSTYLANEDYKTFCMYACMDMMYVHHVYSTRNIELFLYIDCWLVMPCVWQGQGTFGQAASSGSGWNLRLISARGYCSVQNRPAAFLDDLSSIIYYVTEVAGPQASDRSNKKPFQWTGGTCFRDTTGCQLISLLPASQHKDSFKQGGMRLALKQPKIPHRHA